MQIHTIEKDIIVVSIEAEIFPEGIMAAHLKLHDIVTYASGREYYGISRRNGKNGNVYKAAANILDDDEMAHNGLELFTIKKGEYICEILKDYCQNLPSVKMTFDALLADPRIDPDGFCLEANMIGKDLHCMVKLKG